MGIHYSPKIITKGLVFSYDTSDTINCYKGEPTVNCYENFTPWAANGGVNLDVSGQMSVPVPESKTWMFIKDGSDNQWNGWESTYGGIFTGSSGDYWTISYWYKTTDNISSLSSLAFYVSDWSRPYNTTSIDQNRSCIADGEWHYNYSTVQFNESYSNAIIVDGPSWHYSTSAGILYINGLQWEKKSHPTNYTYGTRYTTTSLLDISGKNSTITLDNVSFDSNKKIYFDGTNDCINITDNSGSLRLTTQMTIEIILRPNYSYQYVGITPFSYNRIVNMIIHSGFYISLIYNHVSVSFFNHDEEIYNSIYGGNCELYKYSHLVVTGDDSGIKLYINGKVVEYNTTSVDVNLGEPTDINIGSYNGVDRFFNGNIDIVRVYNRSLNSYEVTNNFTNFKLKYGI